MKYVFYHIFHPLNAPKSAEDLAHYMGRAVGTEMKANYFGLFVKEIRQMVQEINGKGKVHLDVSLPTCDSGRPMRNGQVCITAPRRWGNADIVRLSFTRVDSLWTENTVGKLVKVPFEVLDGVKDKAEKGGEP